MTHALAPLIPLFAAAGATSAGLVAARALGHTRAAGGAGGPAIAALQAAAAGLLLHVVADRGGLARGLRVAGSPAAHGDVRLSP